MAMVDSIKEWKRGAGINPHDRPMFSGSASIAREVRRLQKRADKRKSKQPKAEGFG